MEDAILRDFPQKIADYTHRIEGYFLLAICPGPHFLGASNQHSHLPGTCLSKQFLLLGLPDVPHLAANTHPNKDGFSPMEIKGTVYTDKKEAGCT